MYIRTPAYLNKEKVSTVKKLLELRLVVAVMLSGDYRVATASYSLQAFAIENPDASAERFDQFAVL